MSAKDCRFEAEAQAIHRTPDTISVALHGHRVR